MMNWKDFLGSEKPRRQVTGGVAGLSFEAPKRLSLDRRRMVNVQFSFVDRKDERFVQKVRASVEDYARGVNRERFAFPFFDNEREDLSALNVRNLMGAAPLIYRIMVRPLDDVVDVEFVRLLMAEVSVALDRELIWVAAVHDKPTALSEDSRHAHIIVSGVDRAGKLLRLARQFKLEGIRYLAEKLATERLGPMTDDEVLESKERALRNAGRNYALKKLPGKGWAERRR